MADLDHLAYSIFAQLELASGVQGMVWGQKKLHSTTPGGNQPPSTDAPHIAFRRRYERAHSDQSKRAVIKAALDELWHIRYARKGAVLSNKEVRMAVGSDQRSVSHVAKVWGYTARHVHRCRAEWRQEQAIPSAGVRYPLT